MIQGDVYTTLSTNSGVTAITSTRIYPVRLPQDAALPAVVYQVPNIDPINSMSGHSGADFATVQVTCWATEYSVAHQLAAAVRSAFGASTLKILAESQNDGEDLETHSYSVVLSFRVFAAT